MSGQALHRFFTAHHRSPLQNLIFQADPGATVHVPPGEHLGPFFIPFPLTLVGQGGQTVIWHPDASPIVVLAGGVRLENLHIETTFPAHETTVAYNHSTPTLHNIYPQLPRTVLMPHNPLYNLGELYPGTTVWVPIPQQPAATIHPAKGVVDMPGGVIAVTGTDGEPLTLLRVKLDRLPAETPGKVAAVIQSPDSQLVVYGEVSASHEPENPVQLTAGGRAFIVGDMLLLGPAQYRFMSGQAAATQAVAGVLTHRTDDPHNCLWAITPEPLLLLDGTPVTSFARQRLAPGQVLTWGDLRLNVEDAGHYSQLLDWVDWTVRLSQVGGPEEKTFHVNGAGHYRFTSLLPWLSITPDEIKVSPGSPQPVKLIIDTAYLAWGGATYYPSAFVISRRNAHQFEPLTIIVPQLPLQIDKTTLQFPRGDRATQTLTLTNPSNSATQMQVEDAPPWVQVVPAPTEIPANGGRATVNVYLNPSALPDRPHLTGTLTLSGTNRRATQRVTVQVNVGQPQPAPREDRPTPGRRGTVRQAATPPPRPRQATATPQPPATPPPVAPPPPSARTITSGPLRVTIPPPQRLIHGFHFEQAILINVENTVAATFSGKADLAVDWLEFNDTPWLRIAPGETQALTLCPNPDITVGRWHDDAALVIDGEAGGITHQASIPCGVEIVAPFTRLEVITPFLWLGDNQREDTLIVENHGNVNWTGEVAEVAPWILMQPGTALTVPAGQRLSVTVQSRKPPPERGPYREPRAIVLQEWTSGQQWPVAVGVMIPRR